MCQTVLKIVQKNPRLRSVGFVKLRLKMLRLAQVFADQFGHFKHADRAFAKYGLKLSVGIDVATVLGVLQIVLFDVRPKFFDNLGARKRHRTDHFSQLGAGGQRLHKRGVGLALGARSFFSGLLRRRGASRFFSGGGLFGGRRLLCGFLFYRHF